MKFKQQFPRSVRPSSSNHLSNGVNNKHRVRCSLCDSLLKASTTHRYLLMGKSVHDQFEGEMTYGECCQRYLTVNSQLEKLQMICPKCCQNLQKVHSLHKNAEELTERIRHTWSKTKRLNRTRHTRLNCYTIPSPFSANTTDENMMVNIKEERSVIEQIPSKEHPTINVPETVLVNVPCDLSNNKQRVYPNIRGVRIPHQPIENDPTLKTKTRLQKPIPYSSPKVNINLHKPRKSHLPTSYSLSLPTQIPPSSILDEPRGRLQQSGVNNQSIIPYAQLMIDSPSPSSSSSNQQQTEALPRRPSSNSDQPPLTMAEEPSIDDDRSPSPTGNDDDISPMNTESKATRLSRRQYDFLIKLPDQQSLNNFIETSASDSGSRWTWRRTSANSRGYKVYYVCNFSMRRHYHPCPAAMYALFHPEGSISIYSCGEHQHIPKDRLPVSITDATKDEIFKCLQAGMATTDIRERLTRLQLPFGDTRKLNNFIKYHKELLRFGTVTNVRIGGTAYRQPQCWAIRRQTSGSNTVPVSPDEVAETS